jgi:glycine/D-amino acid oxidase-like deaminating enzyme
MREVSSVGDIKHLLRYARELWPVLADVAWTHAWGGQLAITQDHYPHVHEPAPGIVLCLGYNGRGVALSTALGAHLARRIASPTAAFDMPITNIKTLRFHALWPLGVRAAILRGRLTDYLGI